MPAPPPVDRYQPSFDRFPIQGDRTGFKPVYLPVILVVPGRRTASGTPIANTEVFDVKYFVADAPEPSLVAGPFNTGLLVPSLDRFVLSITALQLADVQIDVKGRQFIDSQGNSKTYEEAQEGDSFEYTLIRGGITSTIPYFPDADYYDMSLFVIDVEDLPKPKRYNFVWQCSYKRRIVFDQATSSIRGPFCLSDEIGVAQFKILINHPGEVHNEMFRKTPPFYFNNDNFKLSDDPILAFYRPFADILQDIFDEQSFLKNINFIDKIPAQLIPYLAYLIGWDLPNFPGVTDEVRRSILRHAVRLQKLKGTRRAIVELFEIFGFSIELINLWYSTDGTYLIAPRTTSGGSSPADIIAQSTVCQIEPMVADYNTTGFGEFEVPLVYRATDDITINAWLVKDGPTRVALQKVVEEVTDDPDYFQNQCQHDVQGHLIPQALFDRLPAGDPTVLAMSEVIVNQKTGQGEISLSTNMTPVINQIGCTYDNIKNLMQVNFDHHLDFSDQTYVFIFATYPRTKLDIPPSLYNLRSNRFDVRIFLRNNQIPTPQLFEFLMNFVFKLKAFHSLLYKIIFDMELVEDYNVQDYCFKQLQVPPPVPEQPEATSAECNDQSVGLGLKQQDLDLRDKIYQALTEEHQIWKDLDGTHKSDPALEHFLNLPVIRPEGEHCQFTQAGQDRVISEPDVDLDQNSDPRQKICAEMPPYPDNCFKGRVKADLNILPVMNLCEKIFCKPCPLGMGIGSYWLYPSNSESVKRDGFGHFKGQNRFSFLGKQISNYNHPIPYSLHFTNRPYLVDFQTDHWLAYQRRSLEIQKDNLFFPDHRFVSMSNLLTDFKSEVWRAKPWDDHAPDLHPRIITCTDGDEELVFDDADLIYPGNGLAPDISSLGSHEDRSYLVTHQIYMVTVPGHPAVQLDSSVLVTSEDAMEFDSSTPFPPYFKSYSPDCHKDYRDGYPSWYGRFEVDVSLYDFSRGGSEDALAEALGLPRRTSSDCSDLASGGTCTLSALFTLGSGILLEESDFEYQYYEPFRLDCDCVRYECASELTESISYQPPITNLTSCMLGFFRQPDGTYDLHCDQLELDPRIVLIEKFGTCSIPLDGTIPNLLCILQQGVIPENSTVAPKGSIHYRDSYGVIYEGQWTYEMNHITGGRLDITLVTKSPGVWGEPSSGYVRGRVVFVRGIITTSRQITVFNPDGSVASSMENSSQKIDFFQANTVCGEAPFVDNFCYHLDCALEDEVENEVICGTRWVAPTDEQVIWPELIVDSSGNVVDYDSEGKQPFIFIDVWHNYEEDEITAICPIASVL